jgi:hypothetical protein
MWVGDNQTSEDAIRDISATTEGSGVFAVPDPQARQPGAIKKVVVSSITYPLCVQLGRFCIAFKWVHKSLSSNITSCPSQDELCVKTCANELCLCIDGICQ